MIELDGNDVPGAGHKDVREHAVAGTELNDEIASGDACVANEVSGDAGTKEVLTSRRGRAWT